MLQNYVTDSYKTVWQINTTVCHKEIQNYVTKSYKTKSQRATKRCHKDLIQFCNILYPLNVLLLTTVPFKERVRTIGPMLERRCLRRDFYKPFSPCMLLLLVKMVHFEFHQNWFSTFIDYLHLYGDRIKLYTDRQRCFQASSLRHQLESNF